MIVKKVTTIASIGFLVSLMGITISLVDKNAELSANMDMVGKFYDLLRDFDRRLTVIEKQVETGQEVDNKVIAQLRHESTQKKRLTERLDQLSHCVSNGEGCEF